MQRHIHTILALSACILCVGCGGFGLGGGSDMGVIPSALEQEDPARKAQLSGRLDVVRGFVPILLERLGVAAGTGPSGLPAGTSATLVGSRGIWSVDLKPEGTFEFPPCYAGAYQLRFRCGERLVAAHPVTLREKARLDVAVHVLGYDLSDVNENGERFELLLDVTVRTHELDTEFVRTIHPDGSAETALPDGTHEFFSAGVVRVVQPDGTILQREDWDDDFIPDALDRDDDNDGIPDRRDVDRDNDGVADRRRAGGSDERLDRVAGHSARPLVTEVDVAVIGGSKRTLDALAPGTLLAIVARTAANGGPSLLDVETRIVRYGRPVYACELRDDGSEDDLVDAWQGMQVSGDRERGDGVFSFVLPVDGTMLDVLHDSLLVVQGRNRSGTRTNVRLTPLSAQLRTSRDGDGGSGLGKALGAFGLYERVVGEERRLVARVDAARGATEGLSVVLLAPDGSTKTLAARDSGGERLLYSSSELPWQTGLYLMLASNRGGAVFYAGFPVRRDM